MRPAGIGWGIAEQRHLAQPARFKQQARHPMRRLGSSRKGGFRHENRIGLFTRQTTRHARHSALSATGVPNPSKGAWGHNRRGAGRRLYGRFFFWGESTGVGPVVNGAEAAATIWRN